MTDELRAAAERINQSGFVWTGDIPVGPGRWTGNPEDAINLAEAYLAQHHSDDDVPATRGFIPNQIGNEHCIVKLLFRDGTEAAIAVVVMSRITISAVRVKNNPTRGDVRRLLAALGIEVPK